MMSRGSRSRGNGELRQTEDEDDLEFMMVEHPFLGLALVAETNEEDEPTLRFGAGAEVYRFSKVD